MLTALYIHSQDVLAFSHNKQLNYTHSSQIPKNFNIASPTVCPYHNRFIIHYNYYYCYCYCYY